MSQSGNPAVTSAEMKDGVCHLSGTLSFETAGDALKAVSVYIDVNKDLTIDMSGVSDSNSVGLALMIEWLAIARSKKHSVTFDQVPNSLRQLAGVCQVDGLI